MPKIPTIQRDDIILDPIDCDFAPERCKTALWSIYNVIKSIHAAGYPDPLKLLECLLFIGIHGNYDDEKKAIVFSGKTNKKYKRGLPSAKYLFKLETAGFVFSDLITAKEYSQKEKIAVKDIQSFALQYEASDWEDVLLGLKLFSEISLRQQGDCFYYGDIRVTFAGAPKLYAPPVDEVFYFLPEEQKELAYAVHNTLESLGCVRNLEREYMTRYKHPAAKSKTFATIYASEDLYFLPEFKKDQKLVFNLNLRNINAYIDYLDECTDNIRESILHTPNCVNCKKQCGGISFTYHGKHYQKCPFHSFRFFDLSKEALANYIQLIQLEAKRINS